MFGIDNYSNEVRDGFKALMKMLNAIAVLLEGDEVSKHLRQVQSELREDGWL